VVRMVCLTLPYSNFSLRRGLEGVARAGYEYVGVGWPHEGEDVLGFEAEGEQVARCLAGCSEFGLRPVVVGRGPTAGADPTALLKRRVDVAKALGAGSIQMAGAASYKRFPSEPLEEDAFLAGHREYVEIVRSAGAHAREVGVTLALKPHTGNTATARHLDKLLPEIGVASVQACYDPGNVHYYEGVSPEEDFPLIADRTFQIVAKDHRGGRAVNDFPVPGEGEVDFQRIFSAAKEADFSGPVVVERVNGTGGTFTAEAIDEQVLRARKNLEGLLKASGLL
jgi:sugar phosphate isomerase/epimerase